MTANELYKQHCLDCTNCREVDSATGVFRRRCRTGMELVRAADNELKLGQENPDAQFVRRFMAAKGISEHERLCAATYADPLVGELLLEFMTYVTADYNRVVKLALDALTQQRVVYIGSLADFNRGEGKASSESNQS